MISVLVLLCLPTNSHAQLYDWAPGVNIELGKAWDPIYPQTNFSNRSCFQAEPNEDDVGAISEIKAKVAFIESQSEIEKIRKASSKLSASGNYGGASGSAKFSRSMSTRSLRTNSSVSWLFWMERTYAPQSTQKLEMTKKGNEVFANRSNDEEFFKQCGRGYVNSVTKGIGIYVLYTAVGSTSESTEKIKQEISAKISATGGSVSAKSNFSSSIKEIDKYAEVKVDVLQRGANDKDLHKIEQLALIRPGDLDALRLQLSPVLKDLKYRSAQILRFDWDSVQDQLEMQDDADRMFAYSLVEDNLLRLNARLREVRMNLTALSALIDSDGGDGIEKKDGAQTKLKQAFEAQDELHDDLLTRVRTCKRNTNSQSCKVPWADEVDVPVSNYLIEPYIEYQGWSQEKIAKEIKYGIRIGFTWSPKIKFRNAPAILEMRILRNDIEILSLAPQEIDLIAKGKKQLIKPITVIKDHPCPKKRDGHTMKRCPHVGNFIESKLRPTIRDEELKKRYVIEYVTMDGDLFTVPIRNGADPQVFHVSN